MASSGGGIDEQHSISCPFCGARSSLLVPLRPKKAKTWTHKCPICEKPWRVKVWIKRGIAQLDVEPDVRPEPGD